ncbi:MAG TPA: hypothetical protein DEV93_01365 [Chloroflexi bacterium]|nr:hypothetical protein [Chloroflexota bacterium]
MLLVDCRGLCLAEAGIRVVDPAVNAHAYRQGTQLSHETVVEHTRVLSQGGFSKVERLGETTGSLE